MQDYFQMGGYAPFVWGSYAVAAAVLVGLGIAARRRLTAQRRLVAELERTRPPRGRATARTAAPPPSSPTASSPPAPPAASPPPSSSPTVGREHALDDA